MGAADDASAADASSSAAPGARAPPERAAAAKPDERDERGADDDATAPGAGAVARPRSGPAARRLRRTSGSPARARHAPRDVRKCTGSRTRSRSRSGGTRRAADAAERDGPGRAADGAPRAFRRFHSSPPRRVFHALRRGRPRGRDAARDGARVPPVRGFPLDAARGEGERPRASVFRRVRRCAVRVQSEGHAAGLPHRPRRARERRAARELRQDAGQEKNERQEQETEMNTNARSCRSRRLGCGWDRKCFASSQMRMSLKRSRKSWH
mmetsp:Transcript_3749/g.15891  ORF Transcript_3749/g.15891 Transcript_3749/m.15891 type:complete len:268 (+) Transcript_3749:659-1462(+)